MESHLGINGNDSQHCDCTDMIEPQAAYLPELTGREPGLSGPRDGLSQRAQLLDVTLLYVPQCHGHHDRQRQTDAGENFRQSSNEVPLDAEAVVDTVVEPLPGAAAVVTTPPTGAAERGRHEDTPVISVEADTSVIARVAPAGLVALIVALAFLRISGGREMVLEGFAIRFDAMEGDVALLAGLRAGAADAEVGERGAALARGMDACRRPDCCGGRQ